MKVQIVSFHCVLKDSLGKVISSSFNQDVITEPSSKTPTNPQQLRGLIDALQGVYAGEKKNFLVPANDAYGLYDPKLLLTLPRSDLPKHLSIRMGAELPMDGRVFRITRLDAKTVTLDANHPLAGQDIYVDLEVVEARDVHPEDLEIPVISPGLHYLH